MKRKPKDTFTGTNVENCTSKIILKNTDFLHNLLQMGAKSMGKCPFHDPTQVNLFVYYIFSDWIEFDSFVQLKMQTTSFKSGLNYRQWRSQGGGAGARAPP